MKILFSWLKELLPLTQSAEAIADLLTRLGIEVENMERVVPSFDNVVVAEVLVVTPHPNADRLRIATVSDGSKEYQVVCGASNCRPGIRTALARIGATLQGPDGKCFSIKASKLRDVDSFGMLCSLDELGLSSHPAEGIVEWENHFALGTDLKTLFSDVIFDISLTPNLGHCLSVLGVARELSALTKIAVHFPKHPLIESQETTPFSIEVSAKKECPVYRAQAIGNITMHPTPFWMRQRLETAGIRSIDILVDISNYVMLELGQPLHFFDKDKITGSTLTACLSTSKNSLELLNQTTVQVPENTLLIADDKGPLALAGVMGGQRSAVSNATRSIVMEAAQFDPSLIRKTAKRLDLRSESSLRFERGIDPLNTQIALERAAYLVSALCPGCKVYKPISSIQAPFTPKVISCRADRVNTLLGTHLTPSEMGEMLSSLGMQNSLQDNVLKVTIPSYRNDVKEEIDLVEEIARINGFDELSSSAKYAFSTLSDNPLYEMEKRLKSALYEQGLQEFLTCDLISPKLSSLTEEITLPAASAIRVLHPSSVDQSILRMSLLPGLLTSVAHNLNQKNNDVRAFEIGKVHFQMENRFYEHISAGIILTGLSRPYHFDPKPSEVDFFDLKGILENLFSLNHVEAVRLEASHLHTFHPGRQAKVFKKDALLGVFGEIHPDKLKPFGIDQRVYYAELSVLEIFHSGVSSVTVQSFSTFPGSDRDWTLIVQEEVSVNDLIEEIKKSSSSLLREVVLLDIYKGKTIGASAKSVTLRFHYLDEKKTLSHEEVEKEHQKITVEVAKKFSLSL